MADVGQNNIEEIDRVTLGGNYGWAVKEGTFSSIAPTGPIGAAAGQSTARACPAGLIDPISGTLGTLEYDHGDGISITGGFVYRGTAIPELFGKYVFGDLALRGRPVRADGRLFYADLQTGTIKEFLMPQFANDQIAQRPDRARLRPGWQRRALCDGDQYAVERHRRHCLQARGRARAGRWHAVARRRRLRRRNASAAISTGLRVSIERRNGRARPNNIEPQHHRVAPAVLRKDMSSVG